MPENRPSIVVMWQGEKRTKGERGSGREGERPREMGSEEKSTLAVIKSNSLVIPSSSGDSPVFPPDLCYGLTADELLICSSPATDLCQESPAVSKGEDGIQICVRPHRPVWELRNVPVRMFVSVSSTRKLARFLNTTQIRFNITNEHFGRQPSLARCTEPHQKKLLGSFSRGGSTV